MSTLTGRCLCDAIEFEFATDEINVTACHCGQCRKWSGHYWASVSGPLEALTIVKGEDRLGWFKSSDIARRGFCRDCGSALFWHGEGHADYKHRIAVAAGALDAPTGISLAEHIFTVDKGDYYAIVDSLPQRSEE